MNYLLKLGCLVIKKLIPCDIIKFLSNCACKNILKSLKKSILFLDEKFFLFDRLKKIRNERSCTVTFLTFNIIIAFLFTYLSSFYMYKSWGMVKSKLFWLSAFYVYFLFANYILYYVCLKKEFLFKSVIFVLGVISFVLIYYSKLFGVRWDLSFLLDVIGGANVGTITSTVHLKDIIKCSIFVIVIYYILFKFLKINKQSIKFHIKKSILILFIAFSVLIHHVIAIKKYHIGNSQEKNRVMIAVFGTSNSILALNSFVIKNSFYLNLFSLVKDSINFYISLNAVQDYGNIQKKYDGKIKTVLVFSDTLRAKSFHVLGYSRATTPYLDQLAKQNKVAIMSSDSCNTYTLASVSCFMGLFDSNTARKDIPKSISSVNKVQFYFEKLGYDTNFIVTAHNNPYNFYLGYKNKYLMGYNGLPVANVDRDLDILPMYYKIFDSHSSQQFIFLYFLGGHAPYDQLIDKRFLHKFGNTETDEDKYDARMLETDYAWAQVIKKAEHEKTPVFMILLSDHGESIHEIYHGKLFNDHGAQYETAPPTQKIVPFAVYTNEAYKKAFPKKVENINKHFKYFKDHHERISSDYVAHSLLDCSSIEGDMVNKKLSLCADI